MGERRNFELGVQVKNRKSQPTDGKLSLKGVWTCGHVT